MKIAVISINNKGDSIAQILKEKLKADLYLKHEIEDFNLKELTKELMVSYKAIIFISSTGIAVRSVAPYLKGKTEDPAVLVVDTLGKYVISLVSGHLGGANELTIKVAGIIDAEPVITTATDSMGVEAPDMVAKRNNLGIDNFKDAKEIAALLVDGKKVTFLDEENKIKLPEGYSDDLQDAEGIVYVTNKEIKTLYLIRKNIVIGVGCKREYPVQKMSETVLRVLKEHNIDFRAVESVATIEIKKDEKSILELAKSLNANLKIFKTEEIKKIQHRYEGSDFVEKSVGVRAVCEPCAELCGAKLLTGKLNCDGMTLCIGEVE